MGAARASSCSAPGAAVVLVAGGYAVLALTGDDAPPPPRLEGRPAAGAATPRGGRWHPVAAGGQLRRLSGRRALPRCRRAHRRRAHERGDGQRHAPATSVQAADLRADMTTAHSDQARRDDTLRFRAIETDRYPTARFTLAGPVAIRARAQPTTGTLTLHGRRARSRSRCVASACRAAGWSSSAARRSASPPSPSSLRASPASSPCATTGCRVPPRPGAGLVRSAARAPHLVEVAMVGKAVASARLLAPLLMMALMVAPARGQAHQPRRRLRAGRRRARPDRRRVRSGRRRHGPAAGHGRCLEPGGSHGADRRIAVRAAGLRRAAPAGPDLRPARSERAVGRDTRAAITRSG